MWSTQNEAFLLLLFGLLFFNCAGFRLNRSFGAEREVCGWAGCGSARRRKRRIKGVVEDFEMFRRWMKRKEEK
jgi:hypothetical protein